MLLVYLVQQLYRVSSSGAVLQPAVDAVDVEEREVVYLPPPRHPADVPRVAEALRTFVCLCTKYAIVYYSIAYMYAILYYILSPAVRMRFIHVC